MLPFSAKSFIQQVGVRLAQFVGASWAGEVVVPKLR